MEGAGFLAEPCVTMRLLFVVDLAYPDHAGGSHRVSYEMARRLAGRGHEVHLVTGRVGDDSDAPREEWVEGVIYHRLARDRRTLFSHGLSYVLGTRRVSGELSRGAPFDVVSAHYFPAALGVLLGGAGRQTPMVLSLHGSWAAEYAVEVPRGRDAPSAGARLARRIRVAPTLATMRVVEHLVIARAARVHVLSNYMREVAARSFGIRGERCVVIPAGVDSAKFAPREERREIRRLLGLPLEGPLLLTVRRLRRRMGLENLVVAMARVVSREPKAHLLVGGKGPLRGELAALIAEHGLTGRVQLLGYVEEERLPLYYQAADLFVLPSLALEGFGLVTLEALACGTPVLGTPVGGTVEILEGLDRRLLFASTRPVDLAEGILGQLAAPVVSREQCRRYVLGRYSWEKTAAEMEALFQEVAGGGRRPGRSNSSRRDPGGRRRVGRRVS